MSYFYYSNFSKYIEGLIEQKQSLGYQYQSSGRILHNMIPPMATGGLTISNPRNSSKFNFALTPLYFSSLL